MKNDLNLLPKGMVSEKTDNRETINLGIIILMVFALIFLIGIPMFKKSNLNKEIENLNKQKDGINETMKNTNLKDKLERYKVQNQEIKRDTQLEKIVNKTEMEYKEILNAIEVSIPKRVKIDKISITAGSENISVSVIGTDEVALADFWNNLRKTKVFDEVNPQGISKVDSSTEGEYEQVYTSTIELVYVQKG